MATVSRFRCPLQLDLDEQNPAQKFKQNRKADLEPPRRSRFLPPGSPEVMELKEVPEDMLDSAWSSLITAGATQQKGPTTPGEKCAGEQPRGADSWPWL